MALPNPALTQIPDSYKWGWSDPEATSLNIARKGLSAEIVEEISRFKGEPEWMTKLRLKAYRHFEARPMPAWGADLSAIDFQDIYYYIAPTDKAVSSWDDVPDYIRRTDRGFRIIGDAPQGEELEAVLKAAGARKGHDVEIGEETLEWQ